MPIAVNQKSAEVDSLAKQWPLLEALMEGTPAMREGTTMYLPRWPNEEADSYKARVATATLFPAYRRTVRVMAGKPFSKDVTLSEETPESIKNWSEDIDLQGVSLHSFAAEMFEESFYGLAGILVDYPDSRPRDKDGKVITDPKKMPPPRTVAQVEATGARPYWVRVKHEQLLGWKAANVAGRMKLTQLRLMESVEEDDGEFGTKTIAQVRVLEPGKWRTFRAGTDTSKAWVLFEEGTTTLADVPFVPLYGSRMAFMMGAAPLLDLAYLNVKHWQSQSDQDTILHVARVPILSVRGVQDTFQLTVGASTAVNLGDSPNAEMKFVEHTGAAIEAGQKALEALEQQMIQTGAELLVKKPGDRSATEAAGDQEGNKSDLQRMTEAAEDSLDQALQFMADYARLPSGGNVSLFKDFGAATLSDASATLIKDLQAAGLISKETAIIELQRRGVLSAEIDPEDELAQAEKDGPPPGSLVDGVDADGNPLKAPVAA